MLYKDENFEFIEGGIYTDTRGYIHIFVGEYETSHGDIRDYFVELKTNNLTTHGTVMNYLRKVDLIEISSTVLGAPKLCHYQYNYGFLGIVSEKELEIIKGNVDYLMSLPVKRVGE